jgi:hypothetical protein
VSDLEPVKLHYWLCVRHFRPPQPHLLPLLAFFQSQHREALQLKRNSNPFSEFPPLELDYSNVDRQTNISNTMLNHSLWLPDHHAMPEQNWSLPYRCKPQEELQTKVISTTSFAYLHLENKQ